MTKYSTIGTGKSPDEKMHGKKAAERLVESGGRIFHANPLQRRAKMHLKWEDGVYLGHATISNGLLLA